jgi:hypothetical protein
LLVISAIQVALLFLSISIFVAVPAFPYQNLLLNGDLSAGSAETPEHWTRPPIVPPDSFIWSHRKGEPAMLEISTVNAPLRHPSYWSQTVNLTQPGWYYLRADVKTENPGTRAAIKVRGAHATAVATQSNEQWTPMEVYFKVGGSEAVQIGCGVRATPDGRAFFRNLILNSISGLPPQGSRQLNIVAEPADLVAPNLDQFVHKEGRGHAGDITALDKIMEVARMPQSERLALLGVQVAKPPSDESLWSDVLKFRVVAPVVFMLAALTYLDWRYRTDASGDAARSRFFQDREVTKSAAAAAFLCLTLLGMWLVTRVEYLPAHGFYVVEPRAVAGDEPHYLVMINSLLLKHDLQLQSVYDDVGRGGPEAGVMLRGVELDRHTIVVNRRSGHRAMGSVKDGRWSRNPATEFAPSPDVYETPAHPAGFPILMAIAIAPMQPRANEVEHDVGFILMLMAWLAVVATYFVGRQVGMGRGWATLAASILFAASPWLAYSRAYFAESTIGLALIGGLWALMSDLPILAALAAAAGAIMKPAFALVGAGFLVCELLEKRWKDAIKIASVLGVPALAIFVYRFWLDRGFGMLSLEPSLQFNQLVDTLVNPVEGLLRYAPWTIFGFVACARAFLLLPKDSRLARTMVLPLFLYLIVLGSIGFGAGYCYGPRYWVAFLPWLALATVEAMREADRYQRALCAVLVLFAAAMAIPGALRYPQLFDKPALDVWRGFY